SPMLTDQVSRQVPQEMKQNRGMLVPIGIQLDASLLHQNTAEVFEWFECVAGEIAFHGWSPGLRFSKSSCSGCVDNSGIHPGRGVFLQASSQIGIPLGLKEIVESPHL